MKREKLSVAIITLIIASAALLGTSQFASATTIFSDNFETGNTNAWNAVQSYLGSSLAATSSVVFRGTYAAVCSLSSNIGTYAYIDYQLSEVPTLYHREYIQIADLPPVGASTDLFGILNTANEHVATVGIDNIGGVNENYRWRVKFYNNSLTNQVVYSSAVALKADTWYYVEIMAHSDTSNGQIFVWIAENGTAVSESSPTISLTGLNNYALHIGKIFFGGYVTGTSGYQTHIYSDEVKASTTWIGPMDYTAPTVGPISVSSTTNGTAVTVSSTITDSGGVDFVIPSWNNTGTWTNLTAINAADSTSYAASFTGTWNSAAGTTVSIIFYANDTSNHWVKSSQRNVVLGKFSASLSANQESLTAGTSATITISITKNGSPFTEYVANITRDGVLYKTNVTTSFTDTESSAQGHTYAIASLYDQSKGQTVTFTATPLNVTWTAASSPLLSTEVIIGISVASVAVIAIVAFLLFRRMKVKT